MWIFSRQSSAFNPIKTTLVPMQNYTQTLLQPILLVQKPNAYVVEQNSVTVNQIMHEAQIFELSSNNMVSQKKHVSLMEAPA